MRSNPFQPLTSSSVTKQSPPTSNNRRHMTQDASNITPPTATPITGPTPINTSNQKQDVSKTTPLSESPSLTIKHLQCPNEHRAFVLHDEFMKLVLKQCTSSRFRIRPPRSVKYNLKVTFVLCMYPFHLLL